MKELPEEIWKMIARNLKREPPPVGEKGNWNDHFHQQDLVSLMRVNLVSPVLIATQRVSMNERIDRGIADI